MTKRDYSITMHEIDGLKQPYHRKAVDVPDGSPVTIMDGSRMRLATVTVMDDGSVDIWLAYHLVDEDESDL